MSYTKGEWKIEFWDDTKRELDLPSRDVRIYSSLHKSYWIADCGLRTDPERVANARLIAAAPKLLRLTKRMLEKWVALYHNISTAGFMDMIDDPEQFQNFEHELRAAIAAAEKGE